MSIRETLSRALAWGDAHVSFDDAVKDLDPLLRGVRPQGFQHSAWVLLEHLRLAQEDILEFCVSEHYRHREWPKQYWPATPEPPSEEAWDASIVGYRKDRLELQRLALDESIDLATAVPNGTGQTWIRELLLVLDHAAYHVAQIVMVRGALGAWKT